VGYFTDLFTEQTYGAFLQSDRTISGFRGSQLGMAKNVQPGDKLLGYVKGVSRWSAVLEVVEGPFIERTPIFVPEDDPYVVRFRVNAAPCLELENAPPIKSEEIFNALSFTRGREEGYWLGPLRRSLQHISDEDGRVLEDVLRRHEIHPTKYPLEPATSREILASSVKTSKGTVTVTVPLDEIESEAESPVMRLGRESSRIQADLGRLGEAIGCKIWIPKSDRNAVTQHWQPRPGTLLDTLPLNYDDATLKTIEQIDILWLKGRSIQRAFEVEHTTAVYSGLLRMADLLALQPNMDIALHIVAPASRSSKVFNEITRPVFSLIERQPLAKRCSFIAYEDLAELMSLKHLNHMGDSVLEEYEEFADV
jgi:hypothetical protein